MIETLPHPPAVIHSTNTSVAPPKVQGDENQPKIYKRTGISGKQWNELIELVRIGNFIAVAARKAGVRPGAVYTARRRHTQGTLKNRVVAGKIAQLKRAEGEAEVERIEVVRAGKTGWQSAGWWLERRFPDRYGQRSRIDIYATVGMLRQSSDQEVGRLYKQAQETLGTAGEDIELLPEEYEVIADGGE